MDQQKREQLRELLHYASALIASMESTLNSNDHLTMKYTSYWHYCRKFNQLMAEVAKVIAPPPFIDLYDIDRMPQSGDMLAANQKEYFDSVHANLCLLRAYFENKLGVVEDEIANLTYFLQSNLRKAIYEEPQRETDIQDAIESLLIGRGYSRGVDYDRESGRVKVSIKEVVPDFVFARLGLALEVKLTADKSKTKRIVDQINADIQTYSKGYAFILFVIYDIGTIRDEVEFKQGLEHADSVSVIIVKH
jgi:hypothetical protein